MGATLGLRRRAIVKDAQRNAFNARLVQLIHICAKTLPLLTGGCGDAALGAIALAIMHHESAAARARRIRHAEAATLARAQRAQRCGPRESGEGGIRVKLGHIRAPRSIRRTKPGALEGAVSIHPPAGLHRESEGRVAQEEGQLPQEDIARSAVGAAQLLRHNGFLRSGRETHLYVYCGGMAHRAYRKAW